ncbi:MAG: hypothetical protein LBC55_01625 [Desulfovibrio sp.]|jgi:hypothetical protein|nr:hypothetical protein [Desulfovibrio sp.]
MNSFWEMTLFRKLRLPITLQHLCNIYGTSPTSKHSCAARRRQRQRRIAPRFFLRKIVFAALIVLVLLLLCLNG